MPASSPGAEGLADRLGHHACDDPAGDYGGRHIGHSPILEPLGAQLRIPYRVLDRAMSEPELQRPGILAAIGVVVPTGVPEHVHVHRKIETCFLAGALDHLREPG